MKRHFPEYDVKKVHGNIPISSKCEWSWNAKQFCFHQDMEIIRGSITSEHLIKRDFD